MVAAFNPLSSSALTSLFRLVHLPAFGPFFLRRSTYRFGLVSSALNAGFNFPFSFVDPPAPSTYASLLIGLLFLGWALLCLLSSPHGISSIHLPLSFHYLCFHSASFPLLMASRSLISVQQFTCASLFLRR